MALIQSNIVSVCYEGVFDQ